MILAASDNEWTRSIWPYHFELSLTIGLISRGLVSELSVTNRSRTRMDFFAAFLNHISVTDPLRREVNLHGLQDTAYFDSASRPDTPLARRQNEQVCWLEGPTERAYVQTAPEVGLEVGTGCTVWTQNMMGFEDHVVFNPGLTSQPAFFRDFVGVASARAGRPIKLAPGDTWYASQILDVEDKVYTPDICYWDRPKPKPMPPWMKPEDLQLRIPESEGFFKREYLDWWKAK